MASLGLPTAELLAIVGSPASSANGSSVKYSPVHRMSIETPKSDTLRTVLSPTATSDRRPVADVGDLTDDECAVLVEALGEPSPTPDPAWDDLPDDWARAWRWSLLLPAAVLEGWTNEITAVTAKHGTPNIGSLDTRVPCSCRGAGVLPSMSSSSGTRYSAAGRRTRRWVAAKRNPKLVGQQRVGAGLDAGDCRER